MLGPTSTTVGLAIPYDTDLENIETYRGYLKNCSKSTYHTISRTALRLLDLPDAELHKFLEESKLMRCCCRISQVDMYIVGSSRLKELGLPDFDVRLARPYQEDVEDMKSYRAYLVRCSKSKVQVIANSAIRMLQLSDEELEPFLLESRALGKYIKIEQKDM
ncbi:MAG: hypothetical protein IJA79_00705 [Desulfovibrio sp.]|nr:hypothetical protein [Desulfovibrio sp.]